MKGALALSLLQAAHSLSLFRRPSLFQSARAPPAPPPVDTTFTEDDGYELLKGHRRPFDWIRTRLRPPAPGTLVLVRHGESTWNANSTFTGWADVDLSQRGEREVEHAARLLLEAGVSVDVAYTSRLRRAIRSSWILLRGLDAVYRPVFKSWRLNERHYGGLTGLSKPMLAAELGDERVQKWRHGLRDRPPPMPEGHAYDAANERKYADLEAVPRTESLADTMDRCLPLWESRIKPDLLAGKNVLVVAHGNSLRGLVKHIDDVSDGDIVNVSIPNGIPLVYSFDRAGGQLNPRNTSVERPHVLSGNFLEKRGLLRAALEAEVMLAKRIPGAGSASVRALAKLELERRLIDLAGDPAALDRALGGPEANGRVSWTTTTTRPPPLAPSVDALYMGLPAAAPPAVPRPEAVAPRYDPGCATLPSTGNGSVIVILRHGKTEHNKLGLFTGWEDAGLAREGRAEARRAGQLLSAHGFKIDVVYTSWLSRAIETAWIALSEMDALWIPIIKSWRLNERMYGALTGLSKKMINRVHGEKQFMKWRRGYTNRPPPVSTFSTYYPGNDARYVQYLVDVRFSVRESLVRSIAAGQFVFARKMPKAESLEDCMKRTIPYFLEEIYPTVVDQRRNVLVSSSENAIRGLLMHLCDIPTERINEVEIPTGLPLIFDVNQKCLRLLDDGEYSTVPEEALARWNFGTALDMLFRPCDSEIGEGEDAENCDASLPDPVIRLATLPPELAGPPTAPYDPDDAVQADDFVLGALMGVDLSQV